MFRRKNYIQNLDLCKLIFFLNTGTPQYSTTQCVLALVTCHGGNQKISSQFAYLPSTILFPMRDHISHRGEDGALG